MVGYSVSFLVKKKSNHTKTAQDKCGILITDIRKKDAEKKKEITAQTKSPTATPQHPPQQQQAPPHPHPSHP